MRFSEYIKGVYERNAFSSAKETEPEAQRSAVSVLR
jgi:hypothetical protein